MVGPISSKRGVAANHRVAAQKKSWADFSSGEEEEDPQELGQLSEAESEDCDDFTNESCKQKGPGVDQDASAFDNASTCFSSPGAVSITPSWTRDHDVDGDCSSTTATESEQPFIGIWSVGGEHHNEGNCKPCIFFKKAVGCSNREDCTFCHFYHERRPRHSKARRRQQTVSEEIGSAARNLENFRLPTSLRESPAEGPWPSPAACLGAVTKACPITEASVGAALSGALKPVNHATWFVERDVIRTPSPEMYFEPAVSSALHPHDYSSWGADVDILRTPSPEPEWDRIR